MSNDTIVGDVVAGGVFAASRAIGVITHASLGIVVDPKNQKLKRLPAIRLK